jgi:hypothetical protein
MLISQFFPTKSQSSQRSSSPEEIPSTISEEISIKRFELQDISSLEQFGTLYKASANHTSNVDWALVRITNQGLLVSNILHIPAEHIAPQMESSSEKNDIEVMTCTASKGSYTGSLCLSPTFLRMEGRKAFEEVLTVKLDGRIGGFMYLVLCQTPKC